MIEKWIDEIKKKSDFKDLGIFLVHNGVVRATSKNGQVVRGMDLSYDKEKLKSLIDSFKKRDGIVDVRVWINEGSLKIGDDIMYVLVAGKLRTYVMPTLQELVSKIKEEIVFEVEYF